MPECPGRYHLALYTAGDMAVEESAALINHLDSCDACQMSLEDLRLNVEAYGKKK